MHILLNRVIKLPTFLGFSQIIFLLGFFSDPPAGPFDVYRESKIKFREEVAKGRQILGTPPNQLFEKKYERLFEGEALTELWRDEAKQRVCIYNMRNYSLREIDT